MNAILWILQVLLALAFAAHGCATLFHLARSEWNSAGITFVLLLMASFVAHRRWRTLPIQR